MKLFALFFATLVSSAVAQYGYGSAYPYPGHGGYEFPAPAPFASSGYQYVTSGFSRPHSLGHGHTPQFSIAKVKSHQNPLGYQYSVHESGPYHHKYHHQTASTQTHYPAYPVIAAASPVHAGIPLSGYAPGIPSYAYGSSHIPTKAIVSHGHGPPHSPGPGFYGPGYPGSHEGPYGGFPGHPGGLPLGGGGPPAPGPMYGPDYGF